jgi:glycosyltransferase involved in cell wall biosynthesis
MRVLIFHGYLLRGTGSNVYNASLVRALSSLGHEVHLLCQERGAASLDWVDRVGRWQDGRLQVESTGGASPGTGSISVYLPDISGLLPVYVRDEYDGFEVKTFPELSDAELDRYLAANIGAVQDVADHAGGVDAALANHEIMGPAILARSGLPFAAKVHGSALEYTVKPNPERFLPYAREGMAAARAILAGSRHTAESLWTALEAPDLPAKTRLGPPGVDTDLFAPIPRGEAPGRLTDLAQTLVAAGPVGRRGGSPSFRPDSSGLGDPHRRPPPAGGAWGRDPGRAAAAIQDFAGASGPRVVFVGKLIVSKGVDLLLAAWPLVVSQNPGARLLVVGFGEYGETVERLWEAVSSGDFGAVREIARRGRALEGGEEGPLRMLLAFLDSLPDGYEAVAKEAAGSVAFAGRLEHDEVGRLVPACDALVFPSTFPESFGMVAAEAASAEVAPVSANHSGAAEVSRALAADLPAEVAHLVSFDLDEGAVVAIAARLNGWLGLEPEESAAARGQLRETAARLWSWEGVARSVIAASAGELDGLSPVPSD